MSAWPRVGVVLVLALVLAGAARAGDSPQAAPASAVKNWAFDLAFYSWVADITGTASGGGTTFDVEPELYNDIIKNLNIAVFGGAEARYRNRWILNLDLNLIRLKNDTHKGPYPVSFGPRSFTKDLGKIDATIPVDTSLGQIQVPVQVQPGTLRVDVPRVESHIGPIAVDWKLTQFNSRALAGYRLADVPLHTLCGGLGTDDPRRVRLDLLAGVRFYWARSEVEVKSPPIRVPPFKVTSSVSGGRATVGGDRIPPQTIALKQVNLPGVQFRGLKFGGTDQNADDTIWWVDPVLGLRVGVDLTPKLSLVTAADVGGFGIGSASSISWEALSFLRYRLGEHWGLGAGYRALSYDKDFGGGNLDLLQHGAVMGASYSF